MNNPLFSIIVPVYNVENYISKCIKSIINQTFTDYELILINDGSTDNSGFICNQFALNDNKIKLVNKRNGGSSDARNVGINSAEGKYLIFLDSDDYFSNANVLAELSSRIEQFEEDLILYCSDDVYSNDLTVSSVGNYDMRVINRHNKNDTINYLYDSHNFPGAAWICCIKKSIIISNQIFFPLGVTAEDYVWILKVLNLVDTIGACNNATVMHLREIPNSVTSRPRFSGIEGIYKCFSYYLDTNDQQSYPYGIKNQMGYAYIVSLLQYRGLSSEEKIKAKTLLRENIDVLSYCTDKKFKIFQILIKLIGLKLASNVLHLVRLYKTNKRNG